jgi:hypothetical protein
MNEPFFYRIAAVNSPTSYAADVLPPGLQINTTNGIINGTPTQVGQYLVNLTITNGAGVETPVLTIIINQTRAAGDLLRASTYTGLLRNVPDGKLLGAASLKVTAKNTLTGTLYYDRVRYKFRGKLDQFQPQAIQLRARGAADLRLTLTVSSDANVEMIRGTIDGGGGTSSFDAFAALPATSLPPGAIGKYTVLIDPDTMGPGLPGGTGAASLSVKKTGAVKIAGVLGDGQKFVSAGPIDDHNQFMFYAAPYKGGGLIGGPMTFALQGTPPTLGANLEWFKKADANSAVYPAGFTKSATATGAFYTKPPRGVKVLALTNGIISLDGSDLSFSPREQPVTLGTNNRFTFTPVIPSFKASINIATGLFSGSFRTATGAPVRKFSGALLPSENRGAGVFVGTAESGQVLLEAAP